MNGSDKCSLTVAARISIAAMPPDIDVYDAAAWSAPTEASVASGSAPQKFPDFTRGKWQPRRPV